MGRIKVGIIGAGISGLTLAKILSERYDVTVLEKKDVPGGIARTKNISNTIYHLVGGHCFNSKHQFIKDFIFNEVLSVDNWHLVERNAKIFFHNQLIEYPIEFAIKQIYQIDKSMALRILKEVCHIDEFSKSDNLESWFKLKFGETLAKEYFIPYNRKIWGMEPKDMNPDWVKGKLPTPNKDTILEALFENKMDLMPHSNFYYQNSKKANYLIDLLAKGTNIWYGYKVDNICKYKNEWWINNTDNFNILVNTAPLNELIQYIKGAPSGIKLYARKLKYNIISNMLWESNKTDLTWRYFPEDKFIFHRHIHIGNFLKVKSNHTIIEAIGRIPEKKIIEDARKLEYLLKPLDYNVSEHAYVVFDKNYESSRKNIFKYLDEIGLYTLGRFGEWAYYNMDICMKRAFDIKEQIVGNKSK